MKKGISVFLAVTAFLLLLTSCGKNEQTAAKNEQVKDYVYRMEEITLPGSGAEYNISQTLKIGDSVYAYGYDWAENGVNYKITFYEIKEDGTVGEEYQIQAKEGISYNDFAASYDGSLYCLKNKYYPSEQNPEEYVDEYYFSKITLGGEEIFSVKLNDVPELQKLYEENGYFNAYDLIVIQGSVYMNCMGTYCHFDKDGNFVSMIKEKDSQNVLDGANLIALSDGRIVAVVYGETGLSLALIDLETGMIKEEYKLPGNSYDYSFYAGTGYDLYLVDSYGLYGYNLGEENKTLILSYIDSDLGFWRIANVMPINEKEFLATYEDMETGQTLVGKFIKVDPSEVKEKQVITLAMAYADWSVRMQVIEFNKTNENYRVDLQDYSSMYATDTDYSAGLTRLNTDIASGKVPDIILIDNSMPIDSYINKGLFEDLKPYIEKDSELDINNFMPNIVEAFSVDGKMYSLVPYYSVQTLLAKTSDVGTERGWTVQEACDIWDSKPEGTEFLTGVDRDSMLYYCMYLAGSQFINWETGKCSFDSDEFVQMLEFLNRFPEELDDNYYTDIYWQNYEYMWRDGSVLTSFAYLGDYRSFNVAEKGTFGEDATIIGFPSADEDGSAIMPGLQLAMSSKSVNKEGAWEFLRTFLLDEYQSELSGFPLSIKRLEELKEEATRRPYYIDENGKKVEYDETWYIGDEEKILEPMTVQEAEEFTQLLYSFQHAYKVDESLSKIIEEETAAYFAGQKTAKDVAAIIQSRAQIYVNETR